MEEIAFKYAVDHINRNRSVLNVFLILNFLNSKENHLEARMI